MPRFCSVMQLNLLHELREVASEVGGLAEARRLPTEVRKWWISEMRKEREQFPTQQGGVTADGRTVIRTAPKTPPRGF